jgi:uncharacterized protein
VPTRSMADIEDFFRQKRLAVLGASRNEKEYSRLICRSLQERGYDVVPINPNTTEMDGARCYARVGEVAPAVDGAFVLLPAEASSLALRECAQAGIKRVWLRNDVAGAKEFAQQNGVQLVSGHCPFMFMPNSESIHKFHAFFNRVVGKYPS